MGIFQDIGAASSYKGSAPVTIHITGLKRTLVYMDKLVKNLPMMNAELRDEFGNDMVRFAKANVKIRSKYIGRDVKLQRHPKGTLHESITILEKGSGKSGYSVKVGIEPNSVAVNYAKWVEEGRPGGARIRGKFTEHSKLKFRNSEGKYVYPREVKQGAAKGMFFMRDAAIMTSEIYRHKAEKKTGNLIKK